MPRDVSGQFTNGLPPELGGERPTLGAALRACRQGQGLTLESVANATRIRRAYLQAIEESNWVALPTGPYIVGYVRNYALALGLNGEKAVDALREERPDPQSALSNPVGLAHQERRRRSPGLLIVGGLVIAAVVGWNVVQRSGEPVQEASVAPPTEGAWLQSTSSTGVIRVSAPLPPPPDQNAPVPYETPGLASARAAQAASGSPGQLSLPTTAAPAVGVSTAPQPAHAPVGAAFNPRAAVHGAAPQDSRLTVQARSSASVIVRRANGDILFARQLAPGEAYRAPLERGLVLDVSDPGAFDVYRDGEFQGQLRESQSRADALLG